MEAKAKRKGGRQSPTWSLDEAVEFARTLKEKVGMEAAAADFVAQGLGYKSIRNGRATLKIGTLTHFGLLARPRKGQYQLSDVAKQILMPRSDEEKALALRTAAANPVLFGELLGRFQGHALPEMLPNILTRDCGVFEDKAALVSDVFRRTMEFAGMLQNGVLVDSVHSQGNSEGEADSGAPRDDDANDVPDEGSPGRRQRDIGGGDTKGGEHEDFSGSDKYQIVLPGKKFAFLVLPEGFSKVDLEKVKKWIEFNEEDLITEKN